MLDALTITEAEAAGLSELAALDLAMARSFAARAQAAEDPDTANALARSYQRMARSYRQSLALKAKLRLETQAAERERPRPFQAPHPVPPPTAEEEARIEARAEALREAVERVIWAEHEPPEGVEVDPDDDALGYHLDLLEERLRQQVRDRGFGRQPLDEHVAAMCRSLGLDPALARRWRELPQSGFTDAPEPLSDWRGSG